MQMVALSCYSNHTLGRGLKSSIGEKQKVEIEKKRSRGRAEVVMLAPLHQERRDKNTTSKLLFFNLCSYCYFIIPFEEEPKQA